MTEDTVGQKIEGPTRELSLPPYYTAPLAGACSLSSLFFVVELPVAGRKESTWRASGENVPSRRRFILTSNSFVTEISPPDIMNPRFVVLARSFRFSPNQSPRGF